MSNWHHYKDHSIYWDDKCKMYFKPPKKIYVDEPTILHREDGPAIKYTNGAECWYLSGKLHRIDGPAITATDGSKSYYEYGVLHRDGGPAIEYSTGEKEWWNRGVLVRAIGWPKEDYSEAEAIGKLIK
jgi:hypothetical protein